MVLIFYPIENRIKATKVTQGGWNIIMENGGSSYNKNCIIIQR